MFVIKEFKNEELETFFDLFQELGIIEIEADWAAQGNFEEFSSICWNNNNEDVELSDSLITKKEHIDFISRGPGIISYLDSFLKSCIPSNYRENFGSFGFIKFKILERDYEIVKFEYSRDLD